MVFQIEKIFSVFSHHLYIILLGKVIVTRSFSIVYSAIGIVFSIYFAFIDISKRVIFVGLGLLATCSSASFQCHSTIFSPFFSPLFPMFHYLFSLS